MHDFGEMCEIIEREVKAIEEKGLTNSNLDTAYKLVKMLYAIDTMEYHDMKKHYYEMEMGGGYDDEYSGSYGGRTGRRGRSSYAGPDRYGRDEDMMPERYDYDRGVSGARGGRRRRDGRGRYMSGYSGAGYDEYRDAKKQYRESKDPNHKSQMITVLNEYLDDFADELSSMARDADCQEEREALQKCVNRIRNMI